MRAHTLARARIERTSPKEKNANKQKKPNRLKDKRTVELLMKHGKLYAILIAAAFFISLVCSLVLLFSVNEVEISYAAYGVAEENLATEALSSLKGKNLLFVKESEAEEKLAAFPRFKLSAVEKSYPNVLKITVEERREVFRLYDGTKTFCLDETGYVLEIVNKELPAERDKIKLSVSSREEEKITATIYTTAAGELIKTSCDDLLYSVIKMARSANLTDLIKEISITDSSEKILKDAVFSTYTGVKIIASDPETRAVDKMKKAVDVYDEHTIDYYKTFSEIIVVLADDGGITATWIRKD